MKIICVGRNYAEHTRELKNDIPDKPVIFLKPDTALLKDNKPFFLPEWSQDIHYEGEIVFRIAKNGKYISEEHAHKYVDEITMGVDFTARDLQSELKSKGLPWELSKSFDGSAVIGSFLKLKGMHNPSAIAFTLEKNGETVQNADTSLMLFPWTKLIAFVSRYITLKTGDLLFTGTPKGVGKVAIGDVLKGSVEGQEVFSFKVK
jgi:2-keto-4-pentenoate hydratase/2-oxohepta-3-ene-1,7-dioic acid hydratase in catechol pathway